ncbi:chromosome partitioning protein [Enterococcus faecium]|uniref:chromosome partitioning protein n=1 Tax=Enterococcus faecium TaxID=1352 RepID=UPI002A5AFB9F|nr:chromosome partitioning protein [Enterococcus faecium]
MVKENLVLEDIHQKSKVIANEVMVTASKASVPLTSNEKADIEQVFSEKTIELSERADRILKDQPSLSENELAIKLIKEDLKNASMFSPMKRILKKAIKHLPERYKD